MTHVTTNPQSGEPRANRVGVPAEVGAPTSVRPFPSRSRDLLVPANGKALPLEANEQSVANDPLAGSASRPKGGANAPPGNVIFSGASAAYYAALFAAEAVKSLGDVQNAYNRQEVESFVHLDKVWDQFAQQDKRFINKQGQSYLWSSIAAFGGAALSAGSFVYGIGATKGWSFLPGSEDLDGDQDVLEQERQLRSNSNTLDAQRRVPTALNDALDTTQETENATSPQHAQEIQVTEGKTSIVMERPDLDEDDLEVGPSRAQQREAERIQTTADGKNVKEMDDSEIDRRLKSIHAKKKQKTAQFQTIAGTVQQLGQAGSSLGQGLGQVQSSGVAQKRDQYDKAKQLTQQVYNVENTGWNSAVQTLKEMTSAAAREINEITSAQQRA